MKKLKKLIKPIILCICVVVLGYALTSISTNRTKLDYNANLDQTALTIDGEPVTFQDMAFYILYEERVVEEQAKIYNPDSTKDYWNMHTNDTFIQEEAKNVILGMVIHDRLFYACAVEEGLDKLTDEEEQQLVFAQTDFWEDMLDCQWDRLPCDEDTINEQIRIAAVAEKYQNYLAEKDGPSQAAYKYDGYYYQQILNDHDVEYNDKLLDRLIIGDITLYHSDVNYINGMTDEEKEESKK